jgi:hypothetical protein
MEIPVRGLRPTVTSAVFPATLAVTFAARDVVKVVCATPRESVLTDGLESDPASVVNVTGTPERPLPDTSSTRAVMVADPPEGPNVCGLAVMSTRSAPALPTFKFSSLPDAPPENAVIVAVPL